MLATCPRPNKSIDVNYHTIALPASQISHAVWLYFRFSLSYRDVEELMAARGIVLTYETIRQWCRKFGQHSANQLRRRPAQTGDKWHLDEVFLTITGKLHYLWRAVDQHGNVLDILVQSRRNKQAAKKFFRKLLKGCHLNLAPISGTMLWRSSRTGERPMPERIAKGCWDSDRVLFCQHCCLPSESPTASKLSVIGAKNGCQYVPRVLRGDKLGSYAAAKKEVLPSVEHRQHKRLNNRAENSHQPTRQREQTMRKFKSAGHAQRFLAAQGPIRDHFCPRRHRLSAQQYRTIRQERFAIWNTITGVQPTA